MKKIKCSYPKVINLIDKIVSDIKNDGIEFNKIVAINRGGCIPARLLATKLDVRQIYSIGIKFYDDTKRGKIPVCYQNLTEVFEDDDVVLIVDDIFESGSSLQIAEKHVRLRGAQTICAATLHIKDGCCEIKGLQPKYCGAHVKKNDWVTYYWE